jgi:dienelactone hydrolase
MPVLLMLTLAAAPSKSEALALAIIEDLRAGRAAEAHARLGPKASPIPAQTLLAAWQQNAQPFGAYQSVELVHQETQGALQVFTHAVKFEKGALQVNTVVNSEKIDGFFIKPVYPEQPAASYVKPDAFTASEVTLGKEPWVLAGTLTVPKGKGPFAAIVLVHGSGPNDRDEAIGANKPFKDLAEGLSSRGVVVLRYDKRTFTHGKKMTGVVKIDDEVILDALAGIQLLAALPQVDAKKIFVVGHSFGAQLAPEIAARGGKQVAGAVALAPPGRTPCEAIIQQLEHVGSQPPLLDQVKAQCEAMKKGTAKGQLLGAPVEYWAEVSSKDGVAAARKLGKPLLVMRGERDYQVIAEDFAAWQKGLAGFKNVTFETVLKANHLFIEGEGVSRPAEYSKPGHVAAVVIDKLAAFVGAK